MTSKRPQAAASRRPTPAGVKETWGGLALPLEPEGRVGMQRAPLRRRLALLWVCLGLGLGIGTFGWNVTADEEWFLAVPIVMVLGWLVVANPEQCMPARDRRRDGASSDP